MGALAPPAPPVPPPMPKARLGLGYGLAKVWLEGTGLGGPARVALALALVPSLVVATACTVYYARLWESFRAWFTYILIPSRTVTPGTQEPLGLGGPARVPLALALVPSLVVATACTVYYARLWESFRAWFTYILIPSRTVTPGTYYSALPLGAGSTCLHLICSRARAGNGLATPPASLRIARDSFITPVRTRCSREEPSSVAVYVSDADPKVAVRIPRPCFYLYSHAARACGSGTH